MKTEILYKIECLEEETPVKGNAMASGNCIFDKECENDIINQLENGNPWAWCYVRVTAYIEGQDTVGVNYLGCCSYAEEDDFIRCGYFVDMKNEAKLSLIENMATVAKNFKKLSSIS